MLVVHGEGSWGGLFPAEMQFVVKAGNHRAGLGKCGLPDYHGAFVLDPDEYNVEAAVHGPA